MLQILVGDPLARLLLLTHQNLGRARHPRHQAAALGPLHAVLSLLGGRVTAPSTFRYATTILLRLLHVRWGGRASVPRQAALGSWRGAESTRPLALDIVRR